MERERVLPTFEELRNIQGPDRPARLRPQRQKKENLLSNIADVNEEELNENDDVMTAVEQQQDVLVFHQKSV
jgi:hypothetical protein